MAPKLLSVVGMVVFWLGLTAHGAASYIISVPGLVLFIACFIYERKEIARARHSEGNMRVASGARGVFLAAQQHSDIRKE